MRLHKNILTVCTAVSLAFSLAFPLAGHAMVSEGAAPPPINVWSMSGQNITLSNYKGHVLIMDFFATWCAPCRMSIPHLIDLNNKYHKQGLEILGLSLDEGGEKGVKTFVTEKKINYPVAMANEDIYVDYGLRSLPTLFVLNKKGVVVKRYYGFNDEIEKSLDALIQKLLAE